MEYFIRLRNNTRSYVEWQRTQEIIDRLFMSVYGIPFHISVLKNADALIFENVRKEKHGSKIGKMVPHEGG